MMKLSITEIDERNKEIQKSALIAGIGILMMASTVPFAEFVIFPKLIDYGNPEITYDNIRENKGLFTLGIFLHLITLIFDVVVAWALYIFLKPVNRNLSLLTAWFRLIFASISLAALLNLVEVLNLTASREYLGLFEDGLFAQVMLAIRNHGLQWTFALAFFGIYLLLLGYLTFRSTYVPKLYGILLIIAGSGYFLEGMRSFFFPQINMDYLMITFFGELVFMLWLLIRGWRVRVQEP